MKTVKLSALIVAAALYVCPAFTFAEDQQNPSAADRAGSAAQNAADKAGAAAQGAADQARDAAAAVGDAAQTAAARAGSQGQMSEDEKFVRGAASGGMMEVQAAKLAQQKAQRQEVKDFAQHIIDDHTKANQQLMQIAQSKQIQVPRELKASQQGELKDLQELEGEDFDNAFVINNVGDHMKMILKFQKCSQKLQDPELKAFATEQLPKLQAHLQHAQQLAGWDAAQSAGAKISGSDDAATPAAGDRQSGGQRSGSSSSTGADRSGRTGTGDTTSGTKSGTDADSNK
jgi:putative membrane protein